MPESVIAFSNAVAAMPKLRHGAADADDAFFVALDHLAAALVAALARFVDEPGALFSAQRSLFLLGGRRDEGRIDLTGALAALQDLDDTHRKSSGYSRLLESTLQGASHDGTFVVDKIDPATLPAAHLTLGLRLQQLGAVLTAIDDFAHALETSAELSAGAAFIDGLLTFVIDDSDDEALLDLAHRWLKHRGARKQLPLLFVFRHALDGVDDDDVALAEKGGLSRALAIWIVGERAAHRMLRTSDDRAAIDKLLVSGGLLPLDVLDVADLLDGADR